MARSKCLTRYIEKDTGCWHHLGHYNQTTGYGEVSVNGAQRGAHVISYLEHIGPIPPGLIVCHVCDNRKCVNPTHLFLDTIAGNNKDMWSKGRGKVPPPMFGEKNPKAKLSDNEVSDIRGYYVLGLSLTKIARMMDTSISTVHRIVNNQTRRVN